MKTINDFKFVKDFINVCAEGYRKGWHERNGGNLSYRITKEEIAACEQFLSDNNPWQEIGTTVPKLADEYFLVTGSGRHMRNVPICPEENICIVRISDDGAKYKIVWGMIQGGKPTSELPTHLMNHEIKKEATNDKYRVIYHAHPCNLIALTFVLPLDDKKFTHELWEMATENPVIFYKGIGVVPWMVPGGRDIAVKTAELMEKYDVAIWAHHGVFCSGENYDDTFGLMDTIEKAAEICVKVRSMGGKNQTIPEPGFVDLARDFNIDLRKEFLNL
ncbi:rhamnulose-1-phosphate aldolase [Anaerobiospirillum thomasii]|uniref:Rhamnulose-1-phosphate aldolase n=1 Tax=Anaerobiospirillum thomasii TaxID=179995 RepID=A0A2X0V391_9GAMM|nr:rhamnulose-1-phosphate aldolase [Anaerobiospirillum thomasii]SPT68999.1 Rhamnulose-1-phosphate aldolase [Anaerobiospirillum thomasii]